MSEDLRHLNTCLQRATLEAFELMCFTSAEPVSHAVSNSGAIMAGCVDFEGDASGQVLLQMDSDTARLLAAGFSGEDEAAMRPEQIEAVLRELVNVVCGGMLSLFAPDGNFTLSSPEIVSPQPVPLQTLQSGFRLPSGDVLASLKFEGLVQTGEPCRAASAF